MADPALRTAVTSLLLGIIAATAQAANIDVAVPSPDQVATVTVEGTLFVGDGDKFVEKTAALRKAIVAFRSDGGAIFDAIKIGDTIRQKGFASLVVGRCASACGVAWLGGIRRFIASGAQIGFHAAYDARNGQETGFANARVGAFLNRIGLADDAVNYITKAPPNSMTWLSLADAKQYGIDVTPLEVPDSFYVTQALARFEPPAPSKPPNAPEKASPDAVRPVQTVQDLHLRTQPDPNAPDAILDPAPSDVMPKGAVVGVSINDCTIRVRAGSGPQKPPINIWCPGGYQNYEGWANAYYLATGDGQRLACVINSAAQGCESETSSPIPQVSPNKPPELKQSERWAVIAGRSELQDAISIAQNYKQEFPGTFVIQSQNGQFAVIIGPIDVQQNPSLLARLTDSNKIPKDSYYSSGSGFVAFFWPARTSARSPPVQKPFTLRDLLPIEKDQKGEAQLE